MTKDDIQLLYEYDRWANNRVLQAVSALSAEQVVGSGERDARRLKPIGAGSLANSA